MNGVWRVFDLSLGEMLWSRRTIFMALVVGGPVILALIVKGVGHYLMREDPAAFNAQLARAVARVTGTAQPLAPR